MMARYDYGMRGDYGSYSPMRRYGAGSYRGGPRRARYEGHGPFGVGYGDRDYYSSDRGGFRGWGYGMGGYDYDAEYRSGRYGGDRGPQWSGTYGRGGDEAVRRYARSHGYDAGYAVQPERGGRFGPAGRGGYGARGYRGWNEGSYDWGYRG